MEIQNTTTQKEDWMNKKWRPMMGWVYMATCTFDFVIAPILWSVVQSIAGGQVTSQWQPLTLQGAGLYHVAMGAVLGLTAFGRTQEKLAGASTPALPSAPQPAVAQMPGPIPVTKPAFSAKKGPTQEEGELL